MDVVPLLGRLLLLFVLLLCFFAAIGVSLWQGALHGRCFNTNGTSYFASELSAFPYVCPLSSSGEKQREAKSDVLVVRR